MCEIWFWRRHSFCGAVGLALLCWHGRFQAHTSTLVKRSRRRAGMDVIRQWTRSISYVERASVYFDLNRRFPPGVHQCQAHNPRASLPHHRSAEPARKQGSTYPHLRWCDLRAEHPHRSIRDLIVSLHSWPQLFGPLEACHPSLCCSEESYRSWVADAPEKDQIGVPYLGKKEEGPVCCANWSLWCGNCCISAGNRSFTSPRHLGMTSNMELSSSNCILWERRCLWFRNWQWVYGTVTSTGICRLAYLTQ